MRTADEPTATVFEDYRGTADEWNDFVVAHPEARFCHLFQYADAVERAYGYRPVRIAVRKGPRLAGILPLSLARSALLGRKLVSQPFSEYGGPLLEEETEEADLSLLVAHIRERCCRERSPMAEMHGVPGIAPLQRERFFLPGNPYGSAVLPLSPDPEELRDARFDPQTRKALHKAERSGIGCFEDATEKRIRETFWPLFLRSMKRLGAPPHPLEYFLRLREAFPREMKIFWAERRGRALSGLMGFATGRRIQITSIVSDDAGWEFRPNDAVHWEFIRWGCRNGYRLFDFGSVRYDGQKNYKRKWGVTIEPSGYFLVAAQESAPARTFASSSVAFNAASRVWGSLVPSGVATAFGPILRKHLVR